MQEHNFDEILEYLCSGIMSKSEKQSVRDELYDHLMCKYETNLAIGLDEEAAVNKAVEELGDASTLRFKLSQVHSYAPKPTLKKAMNMLIFGYVMTSFHISFFTGMREIMTFIGTVCILVAVFCMRKANQKLNLAFYTKTVSSVFALFANAIKPIYSMPFWVEAAAGIISNLLSPVFLILLISGIKELVAPYIGSYPKKIPFDFGLAINGLWGAIYIVIYAVLIDSGETSAEIQSVLLAILLITAVVLNLVIFARSSKLLWNSDHEYKIEDSPKKKALAAVVAIAVAIVPVAAVDISLANQKAETVVYTVDDADLSQIEYERICGNLLSYGIPENVVCSLPKSELKNYSRSVHKSKLSEANRQLLEGCVQTHQNNVCHGLETSFSTCAVGMAEEDGYPIIRVLSWVEYKSSTDYDYSDALFWECDWRHNVAINSGEEYNGDFLLILSREDDKMLKNEPLDIYTDKEALTDRMIGVRFEGKKDLLIIHAENLGLAITKETRMSNYMFEFYHRVMPFSILYPSPLMVYNADDYYNYFEYIRGYSVMLLSWAIPGDEYEPVTEEL